MHHIKQIINRTQIKNKSLMMNERPNMITGYIIDEAIKVLVTEQLMLGLFFRARNSGFISRSSIFFTESAA